MRFIGNVEEDTQIRAVASGTLSNGDTVVVNSDGTVSAASQDSRSQVLGSDVVFESASVNYCSVAYDANAQKVVVAYVDAGNSSYGTAIVGTVSGTSITFGSPVVFNAALSDDTRVVYDANAQKVVIAYRDNGNNNYLTAIVGTVSGTSISFGSETVFAASSNSDEIDLTYDSDAQKVVIAYRDVQNNYYGTAIVGTVSGTSISFGTATVFESAQVSFVTTAYDTNAQKTLIAYRDHGNSNYGTSIIGTVSGTSISFGSHVIFNAAYSLECNAAYDSVNQKVVIAYRDAGNSSRATAIVGEISGSSVTYGSPVVIDTSTSFPTAATYDATSQKVVITYRDAGNSDYGTLVEGTVSGTSISFGSQTVFETSYVYQTDTASAYDANSKVIVLAYRDGATNYGTARVFQSAASPTNVTATNFIGFADSGYLSGQNVGIDSTGSVNRSQSGLTAGQKYYVQNDGSLSTTADDPSVEAGVAISATEILVKG